MLKEAVSGIAKKYGHSYFVKKAKSGQKPKELWRELGENGFTGVNLPVEYGGGGMGITELAIAAKEVASVGCPLLMLVASPTICDTIIARFGTTQQKEKWLPRMASGEMMMSFAITEPDAGSNSHNISTKATKDGDIFRLNGSKYFISGVDEAEAILVVANTGVDENTGRGQLSLFIVDSDSKGLEKHLLPV